MNVLVDTSVWIRALRGQDPFTKALRRLLENEGVLGHDLIYGELLIGDRGGRESLLRDYARLTHVSSVSHADVAAFVRHHGLHGCGIGWIDAHLLASAIVANTRLWTADETLASFARALKIAFSPP